VSTDPRKLRPGELCRLLNSTPLGEVISQGQLRRHRTQAGLRIGEGPSVDLLCYIAWLVVKRHQPQPDNRPPSDQPPPVDPSEVAQGAAALAGEHQRQAHGQELTSKQTALIGALLTEASHTAAAEKAGVSTSTLYRWLHQPAFRTACRQARRELVESAIGRLQAASGEAVDTLLHVARHGRRDTDRLRAAVALLDRALQGLASADVLHGEPPTPEESTAETADVVRILAVRLRQLDQSELPTAEKSRLTATLSDTLLRAIGVDVLDKRLEALQSVLKTRQETKR
jgi:hypothetical protein